MPILIYDYPFRGFLDIEYSGVIYQSWRHSGTRQYTQSYIGWLFSWNTLWTTELPALGSAARYLTFIGSATTNKRLDWIPNLLSYPATRGHTTHKEFKRVKIKYFIQCRTQNEFVGSITAVFGLCFKWSLN